MRFQAGPWPAGRKTQALLSNKPFAADSMRKASIKHTTKAKVAKSLRNYYTSSKKSCFFIAAIGLPDCDALAAARRRELMMRNAADGS